MKSTMLFPQPVRCTTSNRAPPDQCLDGDPLHRVELCMGATRRFGAATVRLVPSVVLFPRCDANRAKMLLPLRLGFQFQPRPVQNQLMALDTNEAPCRKARQIARGHFS